MALLDMRTEAGRHGKGSEVTEDEAETDAGAGGREAQAKGQQSRRR